MNRSKKEALVSNLSNEFGNVNFIYVFEQFGVSVEELAKMRLDASLFGVKVKFVKNTLAKRAAASLPESLFSKVSVMVYGSGDPLEAAKILCGYEKEYKGRLSVKGGMLDGVVCDKSLIAKMSSIGSVTGLKQMFLGMLQSPCSSFVRAIKLISEKMGE